uniref:Uncharacterized protein n=1 Tax=Arundo donax TaxID=35708 RepID=A0A0A9EMS2_ARUDO
MQEKDHLQATNLLQKNRREPNNISFAFF